MATVVTTWRLVMTKTITSAKILYCVIQIPKTITLHTHVPI